MVVVFRNASNMEEDRLEQESLSPTLSSLLSEGTRVAAFEFQEFPLHIQTCV